MTTAQPVSTTLRAHRDASEHAAAITESVGLAAIAAPFSHSLAQQALAKEAPRLHARHGPAPTHGESLASARAQRLDPAEAPRQRPAPARADGAAPTRASHSDPQHIPASAQAPATTTVLPTRATSPHAPAASKPPHAPIPAHAAAHDAPSARATATTGARSIRPAALLQTLGSAAGPRLALGHATPARTPASVAKPSASGAHLARSAQPDDFQAQLSRGLAAAFRQNGGTVNIRLQPDALGEVRIRLDLTPGQVAASFEAGSHEARRLLSSHLADLRSALEARGLEVAGLEVGFKDRLESHAAPEGRDPGGADDHGSGGADSESADAGAHGRGPNPGGTSRLPHDDTSPCVRTPERDHAVPMAEPSVVPGGGPCLRLDAVA